MYKISIKITGPAGFGIKSSGMLIAKTLKRLGLNVFAYTEYPSLIRGGHNTYQIDAADQKVFSSSKQADVLIFLDEQSFVLEKDNITPGGTVIVDKSLANSAQIKKLSKLKIQLVAAPLIESAKFAGDELMKNTVALGVLMAILDFDLAEINKLIKESFLNKKQTIDQNLLAVKVGFDWAKQSKLKTVKHNFKIKKQNKKYLLISGNQACAAGVIAAGCQIYVAYPMTPSTEILHFLSARQKSSGILVHQPEDEIAAIHAALGASFAGARAAVGTSGGGFALMNEGLSLVGMTETPLVIFEVQRPAPATGNPTWSEQGDLKYVVNAGHGEFARIVITPGLATDCFDLVQHAFNLAEQYQTAVIVLTDKHLAESSFTVSADIFDQIDKQQTTVLKKIDLKDKNQLFTRYKITSNGVSPRSIPGQSHGEHIANSDEHDEYGYSCESALVRKNQTDKRLKKLDIIKKEIPLPKLYGSKNAKYTLVSWGSTLAVCLDTIAQNKNINLVHFSYAWPLPTGLEKFLKRFKNLVLVENNKTGQLGQIIRQETGIDIKHKILKYDSRPFWTDEILLNLKNIKK